MNKSDILKKTKIGSQADAEACDYVVCGATGCYDDDIKGSCALCGDAIVYRPHAPKKPKRICLACFLIETKGVLPDEILITPATAEDLKKRLRDES